jgi:pimeloyl-ACP methyl ester carboxylesterase
MTRRRRRPRRPLPVAATPGARLVVAAESGHYVQLDQPELVVDAIRQVVEAARDPAAWASPAAGPAAATPRA